ncbi:hypothetical protein [Pseudonocardia acaciae]|uniref:hypothetical protein n=1 Tax=Pseudonocardia acaciae TaxID=551276 RepID=UPI00048AC4F6|nr:hypothetical protein [Pseudonocardia acaciae]
MGGGHPGGGIPVPPNDPLVPADLRGWFNRIGGVLRRSLPQLLVLQAVAAVVSAVVGVVRSLVTPAGAQVGTGFGGMFGMVVRADAPGGLIAVSLIGVLVMLAVSAFIQGASVFVVVRDAAGRRTSAPDAMRLVMSKAPALVGWGVLAGALIGFGMFALVLPGLYLMVVFGSSLLGVLVVERGTMGRCFVLVHGRFLPTAARLAIVIAVVFAYGWVTMLIAAVLGGGPTSVGTAILRAILLIPVGVAVTAVGVVSYAELRFYENRSVSTPWLASQMSL